MKEKRLSEAFNQKRSNEKNQNLAAATTTTSAFYKQINFHI